jgi:ferredoxin/flavodoxin
MVLNKKIFLYVFSGTGNTLFVSKTFAAELGKYGVASEIIPLPASVPEKIPDDTILCIAFPIYAQTAPPFICDWLRNLPETQNGTPVIIISTLAGFSGLVKGPFYYLLKKKGYTPLAVREFIMPPNFIHQLSSEKKNSAIRESAKPAIANFAKEVAEGNAKWPWRPAFLNPFQFLAEKMFRHCGSGWLGKGFKADRNKCTRCGLCMRLCPVRNITSGKEDYPAWNNKCQQCLRCINYCPTNAIDNGRMRFLYHPIYRCPEIKAEELIKED